MYGLETLTFVRKQQAGKERNVVKLAVTDEAKDVITRLADRYGMKEYVVASAIYRWFVAQDDIYQRAVLGLLHGLEVDAARVYMERLTAGSTKPWGEDVPLEGVHTELKPAANGRPAASKPHQPHGQEAPRIGRARRGN